MNYNGKTTDSYYYNPIPNVKSKLDFKMIGHSLVLDYRQNINNSFLLLHLEVINLVV